MFAYIWVHIVQGGGGRESKLSKGEDHWPNMCCIQKSLTVHLIITVFF